jgi:L-aminopeptidase/D-esterase-like protein
MAPLRNVELCVALAFALAAGAAAQTPRDIELAIAKARYNVPPASDASVADLAARIREQAKKSEIAVRAARARGRRWH